MPVPRSYVPDDPVFTVSEFAKRIDADLQRNWSFVRIEGELSGVKYHVSGHVYFVLKDERARLDVALFRTEARRVRFRLEDGQRVRVLGRASLYATNGRFQIVARNVEAIGQGDLEIAFRQLWDRLAAEGLFDEEHKVEIPRFPTCLGIVTSGSGAALHDIVSAVRRRAPHVRLVLRSARVQGHGASADIAAGIAELDAWGGCDALIVGRGGGSLEDLWAFNEERVARAIWDCRTPVVTGIGHEVDTTIADGVADLRAPTPTAAAELATPDAGELRDVVDSLRVALSRAARGLLRGKRDRVMLLAEARAFRDPTAYCRQRGQDVDRLAERLVNVAGRRVETARLRWEAIAGRLDVLSPLAVLERGYAIARDPAGQVLRRAGDVERGETVEIWLGEGALDCRVEASRPDARLAGKGRPHDG
ncbi:MAG: exodeoxyribonuclease VII large subunit [Gemmatimonadetes bacterium]|nr:exodeoxyribonuclease VII large subunit [Gemmatimonadota bacterium]